MLRTAFSTVATHDWTLDRLAPAAAEWGYQGIDFRTFGSGSSQFACDPYLTGTEKLRKMLAASGVAAACLDTAIAFDEPIFPPVIGLVIGDQEKAVRAAKSAIDLASMIECPYVRVFGFQVPHGESPKAATERITARIAKAADHARGRGVKLVIENGGSFARAADVLAILDEVGSPLVGVSYSLAVGHAAGDDPAGAINALGEKLWVAKVKDFKDGRPCRLGDGDVPCEAFTRELARSGYDGWLVVEWDRAWLTGLDGPENILPAAARSIYSWIAAPRDQSGRPAGRATTAAV